MVDLSEILSSNRRLSALPGLVAVFVGATSGVGETTLKQFAKHANSPRVYFIGRSQEAGDRITAECQALNSEGEFNFIKADVSLIRNVDVICRDIQAKEKAINLLFMTQGSLLVGVETSENLPLVVALPYYSRVRFIVNLLPLLQQASSLRRVVTVLAGTKEGPIDITDFIGRKVSPFSARAHVASMITLSLEAIAKKAAGVSFVHSYPGVVKSGLLRETGWVFMIVLSVLSWVLGLWDHVPYEEAGERHVFLATSARYSPREEDAIGVPLGDGLEVGMGTEGVGSGVYSVGKHGESAGPQIGEILEGMRKKEAIEQLWKHTEEEFSRILD